MSNNQRRKNRDCLPVCAYVDILTQKKKGTELQLPILRHEETEKDANICTRQAQNENERNS